MDSDGGDDNYCEPDKKTAKMEKPIYATTEQEPEDHLDQRIAAS